MGERGPAKKPAHVHADNGTYRTDRHDGPALPCVVPMMPPDMEPTAQAAWGQITQKLQLAGLIAELDQHAVRLLCESWATYLDARDECRKEGLTLKSTKQTKAGMHETTIVNPAYRIAAESWKQVVILLKQFGMTPSSRTGIDFVGARDGSKEEHRVNDILGIVG